MFLQTFANNLLLLTIENASHDAATGQMHKLIFY